MFEPMLRTYVTSEDVAVPVEFDPPHPFGLMTKKRVVGPEVCLDHSEGDLRLHRYAGVAATIVACLMLVAIVGVSVS